MGADADKTNTECVHLTLGPDYISLYWQEVSHCKLFAEANIALLYCIKKAEI